MPAKEYECVRYETLKADKYGYVRVDLNLYSTSPRYAKRGSRKISYNSIEVTDRGESSSS
ncbi:Mu transposase domain-containing protein [Neobacillus sp. Marseille-QA0830]